MDSEARVLVVDDEPIVREVLSRYLRQAGFDVAAAADGQVALDLIEARRPELVVLDLMLPRIDGLEVFRRIRAGDGAAVIMLTARGEEADRIVGLELGADDYVAKPFSPREVVARVKAVLRRTREVATADGGDPEVLRFRELEIDPRTREVRVDDRRVELTPKEFDLLRFMAASPRTVFSRLRLLDELWDIAFEGGPSTVTVHIRRLREKIEADPSNPRSPGDRLGSGLQVRAVSGWRPLTLAGAIALAGALATLAIGALAGVAGDELGHLALLLLPAVALSAATGALVAPLLMRSPLRGRLLAMALVATLVGLANLAVLARLMFLSGHDAAQIGLLLVYSTAAGIGVALATARASVAAVDRLAATAHRLADGDLAARVGPMDAGPELDAVARALDEMAARLSESLERHRAAEAQRRDLVTAVSHGLRTPLAGLRAMVEAIEEGIVDDPPTVRRYVVEMRGAVDSLVVLVDDLFELVQLDAGALGAESERARLDEVVRSAVAACDAQAAEKGLELETKLNGAGTVLCSPRITRVIQNLLQNAIRHTPTDGTVRVEARRGHDQIEVVVEDSGEGIDPAAVERVFDPFWRGDAARSSEGAGLGLALAKRIVETLGGSIVVESEPTRGSRFAIVLPEAR